MQSGIITPLLLLLSFFWIAHNNYRQGNYTGVAVLTALSISMIFESYLERQSGVAVFVIALFLAFFAEKKKQLFQ
jgi:cell shape-determining protein MreD